MPRNVVVLLNNPEGREMVKETCKKRELDFYAFCDLVQAEVEQTGKQRKKGLWDSFDDLIDRIEKTDD